MKKFRISLWIGLFIFIWYTWANVYRILQGDFMGPVMGPVYTIIWLLPAVGWAYLIWKKVDPEPKFSWLSTYGILMILLFSGVFMVEFARKTQISEIFLTGTFDHTFFPIAFGLLFLFDLDKLPGKFWLIIAPFAFFNAMPLLNILANLVFNANIVPGGCPGFFDFFGATSWQGFEFHWENFFCFFRELITFFTMFPGVTGYYIWKNYKKK